MKTLFTITIAVFFSITTQAQLQTCDCQKDLDFTVEILKKTASYKDQIKGQNKHFFNETYKRLSVQMASPLALEDCYKLLLQQKATILDLHQSISFNATLLTDEILKDAQALNSFKNNSYYKSLPRVTVNLEELKEGLEQKPDSSIEGIYNYKDLQTIGIYQTEDPKVYAGVILKSSLSQWEVGMIKFYATNTNDNKFDFYAYKDETLQPRVVPTLSFENGRVWNLKAADNDLNFELSPNEENWVLKNIDEDTQYLAIKNFSAYSTENRKAAKDYLNKYKNSNKAANLIVDLRSNVGGSKYLSDKFLKPFKKSGSKIYVITNAFTGSNGEQFTSKILEIDNSVHVGQTTFGIISYGIDKAPQGTTPSGHFYIQGTNMDFGKEYLQYEGRGITPEITLDFDSEWIQQIEVLITRDQQ